MSIDPTQPVAVEAREGLRIWIRFQDGEEGEIDLSHLAGMGVFKAWQDRSYYSNLGGSHLGLYVEVAWGDEIDLCPDALYMQLTGKSPDEVLPGLSALKTSA